MIVLALLSSISIELGSYQRIVQGWVLRRNDSGACSISKDLPNGPTAAVIATAGSTPNLYLFNKAWVSLASKKSVSIKIDTDGVIAEGNAQAGLFSGYPYIRATFPWEQINYSIGSVGPSTITITANGTLLGIVEGGVPQAALALLVCSQGSTDPFADKP